MPSKDRKSDRGQLRKAPIPQITLPPPEKVKGKRITKR